MLPLGILLTAPASFAADDVRAAAWDEVRVEDLGRVYDANFEPVRCDHRFVVSPDVPRIETAITRTESTFTKVSNQTEIAANAKAWGFVHADGSWTNGTDVAYFGAISKAGLTRVDDDQLTVGDCPGGRYYLASITRGWMYEVDFWGQQENVAGAISAKLGGNLTGGVSAIAKEHGLTYKIRTVGLVPKPGTEDAIFAKTDADMRDAYTTAGEPQPSLVTFKEVPGTTPAVAAVAAEAPATQAAAAPPKAEYVTLTDVDSVTVRLGRVRFPRNAPSGWAWDAMSGAPDISVWVKGGGQILWQSPVAEDAYEYDYRFVNVAVVNPKEVPSLTITLADSDVSASDMVGRYDISFADLGEVPAKGLKLPVDTAEGAHMELLVLPTPANPAGGPRRRRVRAN